MNKFNIGDNVYVFGFDIESKDYTILYITIDTIQLRDSFIVYNGKYHENELSFSLDEIVETQLRNLKQDWEKNTKYYEKRYLEDRSAILNARKKFE